MSDDEFGLRDLAKSMMSCAWAMSVFGMRQMTNLLSAPGQARAKDLAQAVDKLTDAATATFDDSMQTLYRVGTSIQNAAIDVTLGTATFVARQLSEEPTREPEAAPAANVTVPQPVVDREETLPLSDPEHGDDWVLKVQ